MYFYFLLRRYKHIAYTGGLPQYKSIKKVYQDRGLNAQQVSLRASSEDWSEFKILSEALQMSMCKLFVYFLLLDSSEIPNLLKNILIERLLLGLKISDWVYNNPVI